MNEWKMMEGKFMSTHYYSVSVVTGDDKIQDHIVIVIRCYFLTQDGKRVDMKFVVYFYINLR